jgi:hypothetical protein
VELSLEGRENSEWKQKPSAIYLVLTHLVLLWGLITGGVVTIIHLWIRSLETRGNSRFPVTWQQIKCSHPLRSPGSQEAGACERDGPPGGEESWQEEVEGKAKRHVGLIQQRPGSLTADH